MKKKESPEMISTHEFAQRMQINYRTALKWLRAGLVPGANMVVVREKIIYWDIPVTALGMKRPMKPGPKPKKDVNKKGSK